MAGEHEKMFHYLADKGFKIDFFTGRDPSERAARESFYNEFLNTYIKQFDQNGKELTGHTSLRSFITWFPAGQNIQFQKTVDIHNDVIAAKTQVAELKAQVENLTTMVQRLLDRK